MGKSKVPKIVRKKGKEFRKKRLKLTLDGTRYILLENRGKTNSFDVLLEVTDHSLHEWSNFRGQTRVATARLDEDFVNAIITATDIAIGVGPNFPVYEIDQRDKMPPDGERPWWEFYCSLSRARFTEEA